MSDAEEEAAILNIAGQGLQYLQNPIDLDDQDDEPEPEVVLLDEEALLAEPTDQLDADPAENGAEASNGEDNIAGGAEDAEPAEVEVIQEEEDNPFGDDEDSDEEGGGVQVTIRKIEPTEKPAARQGKLDIDATPMINDRPIYDVDLAQMEDRPWRKPGADITDYFNYGFTEETWNMYCERQKKLRAEFSGNQKAANEAIVSSIKIANPLAHPVINNSSSSVVKVLTDNGGRFKANHSNYNQVPPPGAQNDQLIRTVISGNTSSNAPGNQGMGQQNSMMDFTRPPPGMNMPPMGGPPGSLNNSAEAPPGVDPGSDRPPGVDSAPGTASSSGLGVPGVPGVPGGLDLHLGLPPLGFNPNLPPPGMPPGGMNPMGMMATSLPPPGFNMPPPSFQHSRAGFGPGPMGLGGAGGGPGSRTLMPTYPPRESRDGSDDDEERRGSRKRRSRSRSPARRDRDRDSRRRSDRESDRTSSRRHRSRSSSRDRRRRDDREREKRRDRRDDDDRKKRSRRDDDDDRRDSSRKDKSSTRSRVKEEPLDDESAGMPPEGSPIE